MYATPVVPQTEEQKVLILRNEEESPSLLDTGFMAPPREIVFDGSLALLGRGRRKMLELTGPGGEEKP
jgi:hypothetical protein